MIYATLEHLAKIVARLPLSADGVRITPDMEVFVRHGSGTLSFTAGNCAFWKCGEGYQMALPGCNRQYEVWGMDEVYASRDALVTAALAAARPPTIE